MTESRSPDVERKEAILAFAGLIAVLQSVKMLKVVRPMALRIYCIVFACIASVLSPSAIAAAELFRWKDLGVTALPSDDPFFGLAAEHKSRLEVVLRASERRRRGLKMDAAQMERETQSRKTLEEAGLDVGALIAKERRLRLKLRMQRSSVRGELDGRDIRIAGYLLPLEFDGAGVKEFLLVPYAGACVHVPPPPPSQIIHVTSNVAFSAEGLFTPVWVIGTLRVRPTNVNVGLSDGFSNFDVGYGLAAKAVRLYK